MVEGTANEVVESKANEQVVDTADIVKNDVDTAVETNASEEDDDDLVKLGDDEVVEDKKEEVKDKGNSDVDWKAMLKAELDGGKLTKKELFELISHKEEFELDDWEKNFLKHTRNGGSREDFLKYKAIDWDKVQDEDLLLEDAKKLFPNKSDDEIVAYLDDKYGTSEDSTERERRLGAVQKELDAKKLRDLKKAESDRFKIQEAVKPAIDQAELERQRIEEVEKIREFINNLDENKALLASKKVTVNVDGVGEVSLKIDNPQLILDYMNDASVEEKYKRNDKGEPDVVKAQYKAMLDIMGVEKFVSHFAKAGFKRGLKVLKEEGKNIGVTHQQRVVGEREHSHNAKVLLYGEN